MQLINRNLQTINAALNKSNVGVIWI